jgi:hypothetical protein
VDSVTDPVTRYMMALDEVREAAEKLFVPEVLSAVMAPALTTLARAGDVPPPVFGIPSTPNTGGDPLVP